jgi:hypothetical protein
MSDDDETFSLLLTRYALDLDDVPGAAEGGDLQSKGRQIRLLNLGT